MLQPKISISIVIHLQAAMVKALLTDISRFCAGFPLEVVLTVNLPEPLDLAVEEFPFPIRVQNNPFPMGFSANHNQAFLLARGEYFCVLNPDIRLDADPFPAMLVSLSNAAVGVVAPLVLNSEGSVEDSARRFPSPWHVVCKAVGGCKGGHYSIANQPLFPDWVAGMFLIFPKHVYAEVSGFDQRYFLYYEDVDICARLRLLGYQIMLNPQAHVIHHAQRSSHRNFRYLSWHLQSMMQFFFSSVYLKIQWKRLLKCLT